jgi:hypothetical protein
MKTWYLSEVKVKLSSLVEAVRSTDMEIVFRRPNSLNYLNPPTL